MDEENGIVACKAKSHLSHTGKVTLLGGTLIVLINVCEFDLYKFIDLEDCPSRFPTEIQVSLQWRKYMSA